MSSTPDERIDAAFWERIAQGHAHSGPGDYLDEWEPGHEPIGDDETCLECGETGACAFDEQGRPLIHPRSEV